MMVTSFNWSLVTATRFRSVGGRWAAVHVGGVGGGERVEGKISKTMRVQVLASIH